MLFYCCYFLLLIFFLLYFNNQTTNSLYSLEFLTTLLSLARKGDQQLLNAFEASCEGLHYDDETFDQDFFLENAQSIVDEYSKK